MDKTALKEVVNETLGEFLEKEVGESVSERVESTFKKLQAESKASNVDSYGVSNSAKETFAKGFKALALGEVKELKAVINETTDTAGGHTIPMELFQGILRLAGEYGVIAKFAHKYPSTSRSLEIVHNSQGALMGSIVGGTDATNETTVTFDMIEYTKATWQLILGTSRQVEKYEAVDLTNFLMALIAEGFSARLEEQAISGDNVGNNFQGILGDTNVAEYVFTGDTAVSDSMTLVNFTRALVSIPKRARRGAILLMSDDVWATLQVMKDGDNSTLLKSGLVKVNDQNDSALVSDGTFIGAPVYTSEFMPSLAEVGAGGVFAIYGNLDKGLGWTGDSTTAEITESRDATVNGTSAYASRIKFYRANLDFAIGVAEPKALKKFKLAV